ncbi:MAG: hypothetical protein LBT23_11855 [Synergistaceae bacterium]|nr:hypothetical protein [Synergistaceae bacterium]
MPTMEEFERIGGMAERYGVTIFSDEMYRCLADCWKPGKIGNSPRLAASRGLLTAFRPAGGF